jgi:exonuclease SbcC
MQRLEKVIFHNIGPYDHAVIDLTQLGDGARLVALRGKNGAGKTFSLQAAIAGAIYRKMPTQGTLVGRARARDSYVESQIVNGAPWTIRHNLDAVSRKAEAIVLDADGVPVYEGTSVKKFDAWAARCFPTPDVLYATSFAVQKSGGFIDLSSAERISVILQAIGVARLERMAAGARESAKAARTELEKIQARVADERARGEDVTEVEVSLEAARRRVAEADAGAAGARAELEAARVDEQRAVELQKAAEAARARRAELEAAIATSRSNLADLETRLANCRAIVQDGPEIRAAAERVGALDATIAELRTAIARLNGELSTSDAEVRAGREALAGARREKREAEERAQRLVNRLQEEGRVTRAAEALPERRAALNGARAELERLGQEHQALADQRVAGRDDRIVGLRDGLKTISDTASTQDPRALGVIADRALDDDDEMVREAAEAPGRLAAAVKALNAAKAAVPPLEREVADLDRLAARAPEFAAARAELVAVNAEIDAAGQREVTADARAKAAHDACEPKRALIAQRQDEAQRREAERVVAAERAAKLELLTKAEVLVVEREKQLANERDALAYYEAQYAAIPEPSAPPAPDVAGLSRAVETADLAARSAHSAAAVAEQRLAAAREASGRLLLLEAEYSAAAAELADWNRLSADLGRDGLQSAEVDSAGPELTALTNDLLHTCHGTQFTVSIETSRLAADGRSEVEECRVQVIDSVAGREGEAREFSGGQSVIISEAIALALTMLACRRLGATGITLVRDESGAALDPVASRAYIAMLRRAADFVGASRVLLVTHSDECADACDARILIEDGKISYQ